MRDRNDDSVDRLWACGRSPVLFLDPILQAALFILLVSLIFLAFPNIDIWFSGLFYHHEFAFPMHQLGAFNALRALTEVLLLSVVAILIASLAIKLMRPRQPTPIRPSDIIFLLATLVIGPGLVVHAFFKEFWGRPRPDTVEIFGGDLPFVGIWHLSDACASNCSFVSGEASAAIWFVAVAIVLPRQWRKPGLIVACVLAFLLSFNRIAFGRHFLSDVLLAWGVTLLVIAVVHRVIVERPPAWLTNERLEAGLTNFGLRLHRTKPN
jgi:membrane-associated phospholipid phosphatase